MLKPANAPNAGVYVFIRVNIAVQQTMPRPSKNTHLGRARRERHKTVGMRGRPHQHIHLNAQIPGRDNVELSSRINSLHALPINLNAQLSLHDRSIAVAFRHCKLPNAGPASANVRRSDQYLRPAGFPSNEGRHDRDGREQAAHFEMSPARMGRNVAPLDRANAETINLRKACFWTGMAASNRQAMGIQEICRVSAQAVIGSAGQVDWTRYPHLAGLHGALSRRADRTAVDRLSEFRHRRYVRWPKAHRQAARVCGCGTIWSPRNGRHQDRNNLRRLDCSFSCFGS